MSRRRTERGAKKWRRCMGKRLKGTPLPLSSVGLVPRTRTYGMPPCLLRPQGGCSRPGSRHKTMRAGSRGSMLLPQGGCGWLLQANHVQQHMLLLLQGDCREAVAGCCKPAAQFLLLLLLLLQGGRCCRAAGRLQLACTCAASLERSTTRQ